VRVVIAGGSGFLGGALTKRLIADGHRVVVLSREVEGTADEPNLLAVRWTPDGGVGEWASAIDDADAVVNLAGAGIADKRWTPARKELLLRSRVDSTRSLASALRTMKARPPVFIQASAIGFYGSYDNGGEFNEGSSPGSDFLAGLCVAWEAEAHPISALGSRVVIVRNGIVLSSKGGALAKMLPPFRFFVGGRIATGRQSMSWIHLDDWVSLIIWAINTPAVSGAINATAPNPVSNTEFSHAVGRALHRPSWAPVPAVVLRAMFGEMASDMLIRGQRVVPTRTLALGYQFRYPQVSEAMAAAVTFGPTAGL
jgi:uncharacterized protein (TIGR01777 family)